MLRRTTTRRRGVAAIEFALVAIFFLVPTMVSVWEIGRLIQVKQIVSNSAREGARLAGQATTINSNGTVTQIQTNNGSPNVRQVVYQYLLASGLTNLQLSDIQVDFEFLAPRSDGLPATQPYQGEKNQPFKVTVTIKQWSSVRWINLGAISGTTSITHSATWQMLVDDPFTVNSTMPTW